MKRISWLVKVTIVLLLLSFGAAEALVSDFSSGFYTEPMTDDAIETLLSRVNISVLPSEPTKGSIECFSVNQYGAFAVGHRDGTAKTVCLYSQAGAFLCGYSFRCSGAYGIELGRNTLTIDLVREDAAITADRNGEIIKVVGIPNTHENNDYWSKLLYKADIIIGNTEYHSTSTKLIAKTPYGETILYDAGSEVRSGFLSKGLIALFVCCFGIVFERTMGKACGKK